MSCSGVRFQVAWPLPWGGATQQPASGCGPSVVRTIGAVVDGDLAAFADATGTKVRKATAEDLKTWMQWAAAHVPIEGSDLYQPVRFVEVEGQLMMQRDGEPVAAPWDL